MNGKKIIRVPGLAAGNVKGLRDLEKQIKDCVARQTILETMYEKLEKRIEDGPGKENKVRKS